MAATGASMDHRACRIALVPPGEQRLFTAGIRGDVSSLNMSHQTPSPGNPIFTFQIRRLPSSASIDGARWENLRQQEIGVVRLVLPLSDCFAIFRSTYAAVLYDKTEHVRQSFVAYPQQELFSRKRSVSSSWVAQREFVILSSPVPEHGMAKIRAAVLI